MAVCRARLAGQVVWKLAGDAAARRSRVDGSEVL